MFEFLRGNNPKELIGIDIGMQQIRIVELEREDSSKKPILKNYVLAIIENANLHKESPEKIAKILNKTLNKAKIKTKEVAMSLPAFSTFLAIIKSSNIPNSDKEVDNLINLEAKKYVPVPVSEVSLGWTRLNKSLLLIAVPKHVINRYGQIAKQANLNLKALEAETFSLARSLTQGKEQEVAIIDFGAESINISLVEQGKVKTNRTLENQNINQIQQIIDKNKKIILTGGAINKKIFSELKNYQIGNPWQNIQYPVILEQKLKELSPQLSIAVGLALRNFNVKN